MSGWEADVDRHKMADGVQHMMGDEVRWGKHEETDQKNNTGKQTLQTWLWRNAFFSLFKLQHLHSLSRDPWQPLTPPVFLTFRSQYR